MACEGKPPEEHVIVPAGRLSPEALRGIIEEYVTRSGTDYGRREATLAEKCSAVRTQLKSGRAHITYDPSTQTCTIVLSDDVRTLSAGRQKKGIP